MKNMYIFAKYNFFYEKLGVSYPTVLNRNTEATDSLEYKNIILTTSHEDHEKCQGWSLEKRTTQT